MVCVEFVEAFHEATGIGKLCSAELKWCVKGESLNRRLLISLGCSLKSYWLNPLVSQFCGSSVTPTACFPNVNWSFEEIYDYFYVSEFHSVCQRLEKNYCVAQNLRNLSLICEITASTFMSN